MVASDGDTTDIESPNTEPASGAHSVRIRLSSFADPGVYHPTNNNGVGLHELNIFARKGSSGGETVKMIYTLFDGDGDTIRGPITSAAMTDSYQEFGVDLTESEASGISDRTGVELKIEYDSTDTAAANRELWVSAARLEVPPGIDPSCDGTGANEVVVDFAVGGATALTDAMAANSGPHEYCIAASTGYTATGGSSSPGDDDGLPIEDGDVLNGEGTADPERGTRPSVRITADRGLRSVLDGERSGGDADGVKLYDISFFGGDDQVENPTANNDAEESGTTIEPGTDWVIERSRIHGFTSTSGSCDGSDDSANSGTTRGIGSANDNLVMRNVEIDNVGMHWECNETGGGDNTVDNNGVAAGVKTGASGAYEAHQMYVHDNDQGLWCDSGCAPDNDVAMFVVLDSTVEDNGSFGIHYEYTWKAGDLNQKGRILDNTVIGNAYNETPGEDSDIGVVIAQSGDVVNNTVGHSAAHGSSWDDPTFGDSNSDPDCQARRGLSAIDQNRDVNGTPTFFESSGFFPISNSRNNSVETINNNTAAAGTLEFFDAFSWTACPF